MSFFTGNLNILTPNLSKRPRVDRSIGLDGTLNGSTTHAPEHQKPEIVSELALSSRTGVKIDVLKCAGFFLARL